MQKNAISSGFIQPVLQSLQILSFSLQEAANEQTLGGEDEKCRESATCKNLNC